MRLFRVIKAHHGSFGCDSLRCLRLAVICSYENKKS
jgi:hypothetical protein